jgi:hypothetical protein
MKRGDERVLLALVDLDVAVTGVRFDGDGWILTDRAAQVFLVGSAGFLHGKVTRDATVARIGVHAKTCGRRQRERDSAVRAAERVIALRQRAGKDDLAVGRLSRYHGAVRLDLNVAIAGIQLETALAALDINPAIRCSRSHIARRAVDAEVTVAGGKFDYISPAGLSGGVTSDEAGNSLDGVASGVLGVIGMNCGSGATGAAGVTGAGVGDHEAGDAPFDVR